MDPLPIASKPLCVLRVSPLTGSRGCDVYALHIQ